ncbi:unnamed protein product [Arabis nemorensis]|uniref:Peptidase C1A papain C-terminal domain-containing protein n=1 Tax=Arabis nemorensis TaxID=586526 RepID=A0A565C8A4_9BRAS|nr:unnamed protein product [Arabis nemorensis]
MDNRGVLQWPANRFLLFYYGRRLCWSASITAQATALLRLHGTLLFDMPLSIQHVVTWMSFHGLIVEGEGGALRDLMTVHPFLFYEGYVAEAFYPTTWSLNDELPLFPIGTPRFGITDFARLSLTAENASTYEQQLILHLEHSPITCVSPSYPSFGAYNGLGIWYPTPAEVTAGFRFLHAMMLSGHGVDEFGVGYWELQQTRGPAYGYGGFVRIARHLKLIRNAFLMGVNGVGYCYRTFDRMMLRNTSIAYGRVQMYPYLHFN